MTTTQPSGPPTRAGASAPHTPGAAGSRYAAVAYRAETGLRHQLARVARRRGWTPAVLPYPGYGGHGRVRVFGRVLLAPAGTDPAGRRGVPGWQRLLTLELPDVEVEVEVAGERVTTRSDEAGLVDVALDAAPPPGPAAARLTVGSRSTEATLHIASDSAAVGIVCDIDDTVWVTGLHHPARAAWRTLAKSSKGRQAVPGMAELLNGLLQDHPGAPVVYLSNGPWNLAGPASRFLRRHDFPDGPLHMTDWGITPRGWFRSGKAHKRAALDRLSEDFPDVRWVLIGDDGEHDPELYAAFAEQHPQRVLGIALRAVVTGPSQRSDKPAPGADVPVAHASDGEQLLRQLRRQLPQHG